MGTETFATPDTPNAADDSFGAEPGEAGAEGLEVPANSGVAASPVGVSVDGVPTCGAEAPAGTAEPTLS